jgi:hypothetical protein
MYLKVSLATMEPYYAEQYQSPPQQPALAFAANFTITIESSL